MKRKQIKEKLIMFAVLLAGALMFFMVKECRMSKNAVADDNLAFRTSYDALNYYGMFLENIVPEKIKDTDCFSKTIQEWIYVSDTVYHYLMKDSIYINNVEVARQYASIHDSIIDKIVKLSGSGKYSYKDIIKIKHQTTSYADDRRTLQYAREAEPFFDSLDTLSLLTGDKNKILTEYTKYLRHIKRNGIYDKDGMLMFLRKEDVLFRSFLAHLNEMSDKGVMEIIKDTDTICNNIFVASNKGLITPIETMVYMSIRTARRLLLNSQTCIDNINSGNFSIQQGDAYKWMILQPFISIDQFSMATMTSRDNIRFHIIADELDNSEILAKSFGMAHDSLNKQISDQIIKLYILSL